jgi:hypothetical protein
LSPAYERPLFGVALALPLLALGLGWSWAKHRSNSARARKRALHAVLATQRAAIKRAAAANDVPRYFAATRAALQTRLAERWQVAPDEVTAAEAQMRMGEAGAPIVFALETAEHLLYAGVPPAVGSLAAYDMVIERELDQLEA